MMLWSYGLSTSRDKLKPLYSQYYSAYVCETCQDGDLPGAAPTDVVTWWRDLARLRDKLKPFYLQYHSAYGH